MKEFKYLVEELHRGKWQPLMVTGKDGKEVQRYAKITKEQAELNNSQKDAYKLRYVNDTAKPSTNDGVDMDELNELKTQYEAKFGKKAHHMKSIETLKEELLN